ncbi:MAG: ATP12 family protein [Janthinobacterium lividum]
MSGTIRKRFWTAARHEPDGNGYRIMLDERPLKVPGGPVLRLQSEALASAVAGEWSLAGSRIGDVFGPDMLPLTRLAGTQQERVASRRQAVVETLLGYADSDLLCYRATYPDMLAERQQAAWQPWLDWCADRHGARLLVAHGVMPVEQPATATAALERALHAQADAALTGLGVLVPILGSLVLGLAVAEGALGAEAATDLALLDELYQQEHWGTDADTSQRQAALLRETLESARFMTLSGKAIDSPSEICQRWLIGGRVQGVGYRIWLVAEARRLGLTGWVRNLGDGRVEALLRGPEQAVSQLLAKSHRGPASAHVTGIEVEIWTGTVEAVGFAQASSAPEPLTS